MLSVIPPPVICEHFARPSATIIKPTAVRPNAPFQGFVPVEPVSFRLVSYPVELSETLEADSGLESGDSASCDTDLSDSNLVESVLDMSESLDSLDQCIVHDVKPCEDTPSKKASNAMSAVKVIEHYNPVDQLDLVRCFKPAPKPMSRLERVKKSLKRVTRKARKLSLDFAYFQFRALCMIGI